MCPSGPSVGRNTMTTKTPTELETEQVAKYLEFLVTKERDDLRNLRVPHDEEFQTAKYLIEHEDICTCPEFRAKVLSQMARGIYEFRDLGNNAIVRMPITVPDHLKSLYNLASHFKNDNKRRFTWCMAVCLPDEAWYDECWRIHDIFLKYKLDHIKYAATHKVDPYRRIANLDDE